MARILADDFRFGDGLRQDYTKADMLEEARREDVYQQNDEEVQTVPGCGATGCRDSKTVGEIYESNEVIRSQVLVQYSRTHACGMEVRIWPIVAGATEHCSVRR